MESLKDLEKRIGYTFRDESLLLAALTHKSYQYEKPDEAPEHNERLEFLGDSVLALTVVERLFLYEPPLTESAMSRLKSYLVKGMLLSDIAGQLGLGELLRVGKGEEGTGGRHKRSLKANALEALLGAVYLDGGFEPAKKVILDLLGDKIEEALSSGNAHDYKTMLQEETQERFHCLPEYRLASQEGKDHERLYRFEVYVRNELYGSGSGRNKKEAQTLAAAEALAFLRKTSRKPEAEEEEEQKQ